MQACIIAPVTSHLLPLNGRGHPEKNNTGWALEEYCQLNNLSIVEPTTEWDLDLFFWNPYDKVPGAPFLKEMKPLAKDGVSAALYCELSHIDFDDYKKFERWLDSHGYQIFAYPTKV